MAYKGIKPPFSWYGGKIRMAKSIAALLPKHHTYVEAFGGSGAVLFAKEPAEIDVFNDIDGGVVHFYRTLRDPNKVQQLIQFLELVPFSRDEFEFGTLNWESLDDGIARAAYWFIVARQSFAGSFGHNRWSKAGTTNNHARIYRNAVARFEEIHNRLQLVQIDNVSYDRLIKSHDSPETVFYFDPPYVHETRNEGFTDEYNFEMTNADHQIFLINVNNIIGNVIISGYNSSLYEAALPSNKWRRIDIDVYTSAAISPVNKRRTESLWMNYTLEEK